MKAFMKVIGWLWIAVGAITYIFIINSGNDEEMITWIPILLLVFVLPAYFIIRPRSERKGK